MHTSIANLTFGVEFEVILPSPYNRETGADRVAELAGFPVNSRGSVNGQWKVVYDGSVSGAGQGLEFVSPVLKGDDGLEQVRKVCAAFNQMGVTVNHTCGFHVHVGARNEGVDFFKTLGKLYARYEETLDEIMPRPRRGNANNYCRSIKLHIPQLDRATTVREAISAFPSRYHKLNLAAFAKHSTVEFRQHSGTVDASKAVNWIITCLKLVAAAKAGKTGAGPRIARDFSRLDAKARAVAEAISKPEGATADEIRAAHGFKALSIKRQAAIAGIELRTVKQRGKERFFLVATTDPARTIPATLDGLAEVIELDAAEAEYLRARSLAVA